MKEVTERLKGASLGLSAAWSLIYALFNGILAFYYRSWWFLAMTAYHGVLGLMMATVLGVKDRNLKKTARFCGAGILLMSVIVNGVVYLSIKEIRNERYHMIVMIAIAAYTFSLAIHSLIETVKAHRSHEIRKIILRNIGLVGTIGSILSLERSMMGTFGDATEPFTMIMEAASGAVAFLLIILIGIFTIRFAKDR